jgi:acetyl esterase/lipase
LRKQPLEIGPDLRLADLMTFIKAILVKGFRLFAVVSIAHAEVPPEVLPLWPQGKVPEAYGADPAKDIPTLMPFLPEADRSTGAAMIVCPGGGYRMLAEHEGKAYAAWLAERGIAAFVLKYRLGSNGYQHPAMMHDIQRAIRLVRSHASEWKLDPNRIGVMGSSAGGHLASTALTHFDAGKADAEDPIERVSSRPDLGVLCYAVITMGEHTHEGSKTSLLGSTPSPELIALLSNERQVTKETPPCFLWHTRDDQAVSVRNSLDFAEALLRNEVPYELHVFQSGRHGLGMGVKEYTPGRTDESSLHPWTRNLHAWLKEQRFVK